jgi:hypothetical protein
VFFIDSLILNATEWSCRKFQVLTGRTNVWLAMQLTNVSIIIYFVWAALYFWNADTTVRTFVGIFCGGLIYALTQTVFKVSIEEYENSAYRRVAKGLRNPRRIRDAPLRMSFLMLAVVAWLMLGILLSYPILFVYIRLQIHLLVLSYLLIVLTLLLLYLLACDPLPPCAGKVKEWLYAIAGTRATASEPSAAERRSRADSRGAAAFPASLRLAGRSAHDARTSARNPSGAMMSPAPSPTAACDTAAAVRSNTNPA